MYTRSADIMILEFYAEFYSEEEELGHASLYILNARGQRTPHFSSTNYDVTLYLDKVYKHSKVS